MRVEPLLGHETLVAPSVLAAIEAAPDSAAFRVVAIDPSHMDGETFCKVHEIDRDSGANCVVLRGQRAEKSWFFAALIPVGCRMDLGGLVRRAVNARKVSLAPRDEVIAKTGMEYGSITAIGLPSDWPVLVDASLVARDYVYMGSGRTESKLRVPGSHLASGPPFVVVNGLGVRAGAQ